MLLVIKLLFVKYINSKYFILNIFKLITQGFFNYRYLKTGLTADCTSLEFDEDGKLIQIRPAFSENFLAHIPYKFKFKMGGLI